MTQKIFARNNVMTDIFALILFLQLLGKIATETSKQSLVLILTHKTL